MSLAVFNGGRTLHASELAAGEKIVYLLTITFAGREFRWSYPGSYELEKDDGTVLFFHALDAPQVAQAMDFETSSPADLSVSLDGLVFPGDVDIPYLIAQGHRMERAIGELAAISDNGSNLWEDRYVIMRGQISDPIYGDPALPQNAVSFTLEVPTYSDTALFPASSQVIASSDYPDEAQGLVKPFVFGQPGVYTNPGLSGFTAGRSTVYKGTPAITVVISAGYQRLVVAGHLVAPDMYTDVDSTKGLQVYDATDNTNLTIGSFEWHAYRSPWTGQDESFTAVTLNGSTWDPTHEYWVRGWTYTLGTTTEPTWGAFPNTAGTGPMTNAGELLEYMLSQSSLTVDKGRCAVAAALLSGFHLGGYIAEQVSPYEWIVDNLLPILPVSLASGSKGIYPIVWRYDATAKDAVERITEGAHFRRLSGVTVDDSSIINEFSVNYISDGGSLLRRLTLSGAIESTDDGGDDVVFGASSTLFLRPNLYARRSYLDHDQVLYADSLDSEHVWEDATAALIAAWKIRAHAFAKRTITYESGFSYAWLEPGDVILLTDPDLYLTDQVCLVQGKTWDVTGLSFDLLLIYDPPRDSRPVSS